MGRFFDPSPSQEVGQLEVDEVEVEDAPTTL